MERLKRYAKPLVATEALVEVGLKRLLSETEDGEAHIASDWKSLLEQIHDHDVRRKAGKVQGLEDLGSFWSMKSAASLARLSQAATTIEEMQVCILQLLQKMDARLERLEAQLPMGDAAPS